MSRRTSKPNRRYVADASSDPISPVKRARPASEVETLSDHGTQARLGRDTTPSQLQQLPGTDGDESTAGDTDSASVRDLYQREPADLDILPMQHNTATMDDGTYEATALQWPIDGLTKDQILSDCFNDTFLGDPDGPAARLQVISTRLCASLRTHTCMLTPRHIKSMRKSSHDKSLHRGSGRRRSRLCAAKEPPGRQKLRHQCMRIKPIGQPTIVCQQQIRTIAVPPAAQVYSQHGLLCRTEPRFECT